MFSVLNRELFAPGDVREIPPVILPPSADCCSNPTGGGHVKAAAFFPYGCVGFCSVEMQSPAGNGERPSATAVLLLPEGQRWLQDQLGGCPLPSPEQPLECCPRAFGWAGWSCASLCFHQVHQPWEGRWLKLKLVLQTPSV